MFERIKLFFGYLLKGTISYGILKPCYRCVYAKSTEPIVFVSGSTLEVKCILYQKKPLYVRRGSCLGVKNCFRCFEKIQDPSIDLPCVWYKF